MTHLGVSMAASLGENVTESGVDLHGVHEIHVAQLPEPVIVIVRFSVSLNSKV